MKRPVPLSHFVDVRSGLVVEIAIAFLLDWLTGTPFYFTFPALVFTPLLFAACTRPPNDKNRRDSA